MHHQFDKPVPVILGTTLYVVSGTREAIDILQLQWPPSASHFCRDAANQALSECTSRKRNARLLRSAREAFVAAAAEADLLVYERSSFSTHHSRGAPHLGTDPK